LHLHCGEATAMQKLKAIERRLTGEGCEGRLNDVERLYEFCESEDLNLVAEALKAIGRVLAHHRQRLGNAPSEPADEKEKEAAAAVADFLRKHTEAYHTTLVNLATSSSPRAQVCAIRLAFATLHSEAEEARHGVARSASGGRSPLILPPPERRVQNLLSHLLVDDRWSTHVVSCLLDEYVQHYVDVRHYVVCHLRACAEMLGKTDLSAVVDAGADDGPAAKRRRKTESPFIQAVRSKGRTADELFTRLLTLLKEAPEPVPVPKAEDDALSEVEVLAPMGRPVGHFLREYRKLFQDAWLQLLALRAPLQHCTPLLQLIPSRVMPHISSPLMLADFYLRAFDSGSAEVSVLSLSGLLVLLTKYGLGDPETLSTSSQKFYAQLYSLIKAETFALKKRARFQRLLGASLGSGLLPARFAGVFAKKCVHVAVCCSEPGTVMWLMAMAYSLIQRHHSHCKYLLHSPGGADAEAQRGDPFDADASLDAAMEQMKGTCLWEVQVFRMHHLPAISTLAKVFLKPFFKPTSRKLDPELFLDQSFERMYEQSMKTSERQAMKLQARFEKCPVNFKVEDDELAAKVFGWAAALSTSQRQVGPGL